MSRRFTLEEYLEGFVDEHIESAEEEMKLLVTDAQVHTVGLFFIEGMVGLIKCLRNERGMPLSQRTLTAPTLFGCELVRRFDSNTEIA